MKVNSVCLASYIWLLVSCSRTPYASFGGGPKRLTAGPKKQYAQVQTQQPTENIGSVLSPSEEQNAAPFLSPEAGTTKNLRKVLRKLDRKEAHASSVRLSAMEKIQVARDVYRLKKEIEKSEVVQDAAAPKAHGSNQLVAAILCFLLGYLGIHRFYLGYIWQGVLQLVTAGGCGFWALIDLVRILMGDLKPKGGSYTEKLDDLDL